jgi:ribosomal protein S3
MHLPKFLALFTHHAGADMSLEFDKLKNRVAVAVATITHQNTLIGEKDAKITELHAQIGSLLAASPAAPEIKEEDYAALTAQIETAVLPLEVTGAALAEPTILPQADPAHPALQG